MRDDSVYLGHMLDMARKAAEFVAGKDRSAFDKDEVLQLALAHLLQVIGEAARQVSQPFRDAHPEIPWKQITGMRHRVVHDYMNIDEDVVWKTATEDLPILIAQLEKVLPSDEERS